MGCFHGNAIAECPDMRCQGGENADADATATRAAEVFREARGEQIDIVFDGPPGPIAGRFVEVEDADGKSIRVGEWIERPDGTWALRIEGVRVAR